MSKVNALVGRIYVLIEEQKLCYAAKTWFKRTFLWKLPAPEEGGRWKLRLNINVVHFWFSHLFTFKVI